MIAYPALLRGAGAGISFPANIDVFDDFAIAFISIVIKPEAAASRMGKTTAVDASLLEASHIIALADCTNCM